MWRSTGEGPSAEAENSRLIDVARTLCRLRGLGHAVLFEDELHASLMLGRRGTARRSRILSIGLQRRLITTPTMPVRNEGLLLGEPVRCCSLLTGKGASLLETDGLPCVVLSRGHGSFAVTASHLVYELGIRPSLFSCPVDVWGPAPGACSTWTVGGKTPVCEDHPPEGNDLFGTALEPHADLQPAWGIIDKLQSRSCDPVAAVVRLDLSTLAPVNVQEVQVEAASFPALRDRS
mmetsp:Transcript_581/g.1330  ORF Transcript_581/g.1330 Transcript_581/m.1330 type:complete len:234 (-) Transcript_581:1144-1845(-)